MAKANATFEGRKEETTAPLEGKAVPGTESTTTVTETVTTVTSAVTPPDVKEDIASPSTDEGEE